MFIFSGTPMRMADAFCERPEKSVSIRIFSFHFSPAAESPGRF
jgi:hypothetical protein